MEEWIIRDGVLEAYTGRAETVRVPEEVRVIGEGAFKACVSLQEVILPSGLTEIRDHAFKGCRRLAKIRIPEEVSRIGSYAFHRCHALTEAVLPPLVEELGDCVFLYCDSLTEVRMPGVRRLGRQVFVNDVLLKKLEISKELEEDCICDVFTGCGRIRQIRFADGECWQIANAVEAVTGGQSLPGLVRLIAVDVLRMMELDGRCLVRFLTNLKHVEIPEGIECLGKSCFFDKRGILSVRLPRSLKEIKSRAFRNCISLERVEFAGAQVRIHEDAFCNCTSLREVQTDGGKIYEFTGLSGIRQKEVPDLVRVIQKQVLGNFRISGTMLLKYLGSESRVVVPEGITRIAEKAFAGKEAIDRVILPESVRSIGAEAFRDCLLLQTIQFPEGLNEIGARAFENCVKLIRIHLPAGVTELPLRAFQHCRALREVQFPEGFQKIGESAFYGCTALRTIRFPESLTSIGRMAFYRCRGLREVRLPAGTEHVESLAFAGSGIRKAWVAGSGRYFGTDVFADCVQLKEMMLTDNVRHIPDKFAYGCTALQKVVLSDSLCSAGRHAWEGTPFLAGCLNGQTGPILWDGRDLEGEVRLPEQIRILAGGAFYGNEKVTRIHLPKGLEWIGPAAFKGCERLRQVLMPPEAARRIRELEAEVFSGCLELEEITVQDGALPEWETVGERTFYRCGRLKEISWAGLRLIGKEAFAGCRSLRVEEPKALTLIGERAFADTGSWAEGAEAPAVFGGIVISGSGCEGEVRIPEQVTGIAPYAFAGNGRITRIVCPKSLLWIGEGAFFGCRALTEAVFPEGLLRIGARAFERCLSLREVQTAARQAGASAFAGCRALRRAVLPGVSVLAERLFAGCGELEECVCGQAGEVQSFCFSGCRKLSKVSTAGLRVIRARAFEGCDRLREAEWQDGACIGEHAFEDCGGLETVRLTGGRGCVHLAEYALSGCTALRRVFFQGEEWAFRAYRDILDEEIPETVRLLFHSAFSCFEVEREEELCGYRGAGRKVRIPEGIRRIRAEVFRDCLMLEEIEIPKSVEHIGARAFHGTAWMEAQRRRSPFVTVRDMLLDGSGCTKEVTVPKEIRLVCGWAFAGGVDIERIRFTSDRVRVEEYAFRNCVNLREMVLPDGSSVHFTGIEDRQKELPPLAKQAVLDSLNCFKTDADGVLLACTGNISRLRVAHGITAIGEGAFRDGNLLTRILLPDTVSSVGKSAFQGCNGFRKSGAPLGWSGSESGPSPAAASCGGWSCPRRCSRSAPEPSSTAHPWKRSCCRKGSRRSRTGRSIGAIDCDAWCSRPRCGGSERRRSPSAGSSPDPPFRKGSRWENVRSKDAADGREPDAPAETGQDGTSGVGGRFRDDPHPEGECSGPAGLL